MLFLWKQLVLSRAEVCCPLWSPMDKGNIQCLESVQKTFTKKIDGVEGLDYWQRLSHLQLYSLQRRRERYDIMYVWKIIEGKVPNISAQSNRQIQTYQHVRHGRLCVVPEPSRAAKTHIKTLVNNSFVVRALKLFNAIPKYIRKITDCDELDIYIRRLEMCLNHL